MYGAGSQSDPQGQHESSRVGGDVRLLIGAGIPSDRRGETIGLGGRGLEGGATVVECVRTVLDPTQHFPRR